MGFSYLSGLSWFELSREERFYCSELFQELKQNKKLLKWLINGKQTILEPFFEEDQDWEIAYEVAFYRDFKKYHGISDEKNEFSNKRTFDLCLFSEKRIIIIEAKAQQPFSPREFETFNKDKKLIRSLIERDGGGNIKIDTLGICSSLYINSPYRHNSLEVFDCVVSWKELYNQTNKDIFLRADNIYRK